MNCHFCVWKQRKAISERDRNSLQIHRGKKEIQEGREEGKGKERVWNSREMVGCGGGGLSLERSVVNQ